MTVTNQNYIQEKIQRRSLWGLLSPITFTLLISYLKLKYNKKVQFHLLFCKGVELVSHPKEQTQTEGSENKVLKKMYSCKEGNSRRFEKYAYRQV
jgi:hypothetical protein